MDGNDPEGDASTGTLYQKVLWTKPEGLEDFRFRPRAVPGTAVVLAAYAFPWGVLGGDRLAFVWREGAWTFMGPLEVMLLFVLVLTGVFVGSLLQLAHPGGALCAVAHLAILPIASPFLGGFDSIGWGFLLALAGAALWSLDPFTRGFLRELWETRGGTPPPVDAAPARGGGAYDAPDIPARWVEASMEGELRARPTDLRTRGDYEETIRRALRLPLWLTLLLPSLLLAAGALAAHLFLSVARRGTVFLPGTSVGVPLGWFLAGASLVVAGAAAILWEHQRRNFCNVAARWSVALAYRLRAQDIEVWANPFQPFAQVDIEFPEPSGDGVATLTFFRSGRRLRAELEHDDICVHFDPRRDIEPAVIFAQAGILPIGEATPMAGLKP